MQRISPWLLNYNRLTLKPWHPSEHSGIITAIFGGQVGYYKKDFSDVHTEKSVLLEELGEKGFRDAIAKALADKDINGAPDIIEALKNYNTVGNINYLDLVLHPLISKYWNDRGSDMDFSKIKVPAYFGAATHRPSVCYYWPDFKMPKKLLFFPPAYMDRPFYQLSWELP